MAGPSLIPSPQGPEHLTEAPAVQALRAGAAQWHPSKARPGTGEQGSGAGSALPPRPPMPSIPGCLNVQGLYLTLGFLPQSCPHFLFGRALAGWEQWL